MSQMKSKPNFAGAVVGVILAISVGAAWAQSGTDGADAVRNALGKQEGDKDQNDLLKETLTSRDK